MQLSTNCYAYILNRPYGFPPEHKLQPGELSGNPLRSASDVNTFRIIELVRQDALFGGFIFEDAVNDLPCDPGTYKVALVVDPGVDYHWYRQNPDGTWSGKSGHTAVTDLDASGNIITDPRTADRNYGFLNYSEFDGNATQPGSSKPELSDFDFVELGMSYDEVVSRMGEADRDIGSGIHLMVYELVDGTEIVLSFPSLTNLVAVHIYDPETGERELILGS